MSTTTPTLLQRILNTKHQEVALGLRQHPLSELKAQVRDRPGPRPFEAALVQRIRSGQPAIIAEIKRASPSKGILREPFRPAEIAPLYEQAGAACLSVLTDKEYFQGHVDDLKAAHAACGLPILRKDFMVDAYQVWEARAIGADAILLIVAALSLAQMQDLEGLAHELGMAVLVEVHNEVEWEQALHLKTPLIGVNNRNLHDFSVSLNTTLGLCRYLPAGRVLISESGILTTQDVQTLRAEKINGFLVGEAFMRAEDPGQALKALFF